jgi:hypothetical protein
MNKLRIRAMAYEYSQKYHCSMNKAIKDINRKIRIEMKRRR